MTNLIQGVGTNDADYAVYPKVNGKRIICPFYKVWSHILERCYSDKFQERNPEYIGCTTSHEWHSFMSFKGWMEKQDWQGKEPDKDILVVGNKVYSPETCVFVDSTTNAFTTDRAAMRGKWPLGVCLFKHSGKFTSHCSNPFTKKKEYLGSFNCPEQAHEAWRKRKHELACQLADIQTDQHVADALRLRYQVTTVQRTDSE